MSFSSDFKKFIGKSKTRAKEISVASAFQIQNGMQLKSPVDSGALRQSIQISVGDTTVDKGIVSFDLGDKIFITTNLPYAAVVEYGLFGNPPGSANGPKTINGFSSQAPAGFRGLTVQEFKDYVRKAVRG